MRAFVFGIAVTVATIVATVWCVSRFGLYPIGADNPPGSLEDSLAGRAMDVYAEKHMPQGTNPVEITPATLIEGATQYEQRCALCHGGAKTRTSPMENKFSPPPPQLINRVPHDPEPWLFWVTKHGVRMTGMPAWNDVLTDDQIWKVVAFIKRSGALPPEVNAAWEQVATEPTRFDSAPASGR